MIVRSSGLAAWESGRGGRPLILAHRGHSYRAPENTIEAAEAGLQAGADGWELDVRLTADGVPVVFHDASLLRTTDVARRYAADPRADSGYPLAAFSLAEVRALDAGGWFIDPLGGPRSARAFRTLDLLPSADRATYASGSVRVPTLDEALAFTVDRRWLVNVEIKAIDRGAAALAEMVASAIRRFGPRDRAWISSFDHRLVRCLGEAWPEIATGALTVRGISGSARYVRDVLEANAYHPSVEGFLAVADGKGSSANASAPPVFVYTLNDPTPAGPWQALKSFGVTGLFTDNPDAFVS